MKLLVWLIAFFTLGYSIETSPMMSFTIKPHYDVPRLLHMRDRHMEATVALLTSLRSSLTLHKKTLVKVTVEHNKLMREIIKVEKVIRRLVVKKERQVVLLKKAKRKCFLPGLHLKKCKKKVVVLTTEIKRFTRRYKAWMVLRHKTEPKLKARILHLKEFRQQIKRKLITGFEARSILEDEIAKSPALDIDGDLDIEGLSFAFNTYGEGEKKTVTKDSATMIKAIDRMIQVLQGSIDKLITKEKTVLKELVVVRRKLKKQTLCVTKGEKKMKECNKIITGIKKEITTITIEIGNRKAEKQAKVIEHRKEMIIVCQRIPTLRGVILTLKRIISLVEQIKKGDLEVVVRPQIVKMVLKYIMIKKYQVVKIIRTLKKFIVTDKKLRIIWTKKIKLLHETYIKHKKSLLKMEKEWIRFLKEYKKISSSCQTITNSLYTVTRLLASKKVLLKNAVTKMEVWVELKKKDIPRLSTEIGGLHDLIVLTKNAMKEVVCKTTSNQVCVFPFRLNGKLYNKCVVKDSDGRKWCATMIKPGGDFNGDSWGYCEPSCESQTARILVRQRLAAVFGSSHSIVVERKLSNVIRLLNSMISVLDGSRNKLYRLVKQARKVVHKFKLIISKITVQHKTLKTKDHKCRKKLAEFVKKHLDFRTGIITLRDLVKASWSNWKTEVTKFTKLKPAIAREEKISRSIITYCHALANGTVSVNFKFKCKMLKGDVQVNGN